MTHNDGLFQLFSSWENQNCDVFTRRFPFPEGVHVCRFGLIGVTLQGCAALLTYLNVEGRWTWYNVTVLHVYGQGMIDHILDADSEINYQHRHFSSQRMTPGGNIIIPSVIRGRQSEASSASATESLSSSHSSLLRPGSPQPVAGLTSESSSSGANGSPHSFLQRPSRVVNSLEHALSHFEFFGHYTPASALAEAPKAEEHEVFSEGSSKGMCGCMHVCAVAMSRTVRLLVQQASTCKGKPALNAENE